MVLCERYKLPCVEVMKDGGSEVASRTNFHESDYATATSLHRSVERMCEWLRSQSRRQGAITT